MAADNLSLTIYEELSERILRWDYLPGHRLTEDALCAEFSVSRSPVREALSTLVENGLVDKKPKQGYQVRKLDFKEIDELYDLRTALEDFVIGKLCGAGSEPKRLDELAAYWKDLLEGLPATAVKVPAADEKFHEILCALIGNSTLSKTLKDIDRQIHFVRLADITSPQRVLATCEEHIELLRAVMDKDPDRALAALHRNIEGGKSSVERAIKEALAHAYRNRD